MPVVFAANQVSQREQGYRDLLDSAYEYPKTYRKRVVTGDTFIYYRGTKGPGPHGYFGTGRVGEIRPSPNDAAGRLICLVADVEFFATAVPLRDPDSDEYLETVGQNRVALRQGVRLIDDIVLRRILELGRGRN